MISIIVCCLLWKFLVVSLLTRLKAHLLSSSTSYTIPKPIKRKREEVKPYHPVLLPSWLVGDPSQEYSTRGKWRRILPSPTCHTLSCCRHYTLHRWPSPNVPSNRPECRHFQQPAASSSSQLCGLPTAPRMGKLRVHLYCCPSTQSLWSLLKDERMLMVNFSRYYHLCKKQVSNNFFMYTQRLSTSYFL